MKIGKIIYPKNAKEKHGPQELPGNFGHRDVWTWVAIDADTELVPCWHVGPRNARTARDFMCDLASRLANHVQLTIDGQRVYLQVVEQAFCNDSDYAVLVKLYGSDQSEGKVRYNQADLVTC